MYQSLPRSSQARSLKVLHSSAHLPQSDVTSMYVIRWLLQDCCFSMRKGTVSVLLTIMVLVLSSEWMNDGIATES